LFERWFSNALAQLEKLDNQDGGTAGMMIVLPLYERYIVIQQKKTGAPFLECMAKDLQLNSSNEADVFWKTFRHGFCHAAMPLERARDGRPLPKARFSSHFSWRPEFRTEGIDLICLDPWKFIHYVMDKYRNDPALLEQHPDAPLLAIHLFG
jgi:hypothetical protein